MFWCVLYHRLGVCFWLPKAKIRLILLCSYVVNRTCASICCKNRTFQSVPWSTDGLHTLISEHLVRSVVCGISFFAAGAVFGTLLLLQLPLSGERLSALVRPREVRCCLRLSCHFRWQPQYLVILRLATLDLTLPTVDSTISTTIVTLKNSHSSLHTSHFTLDISHSTHLTLNTLRSTVNTPLSTRYTARLTLHITKPYSIQSRLHTPHSSLHPPYSTLHTTEGIMVESP